MGAASGAGAQPCPHTCGISRSCRTACSKGRDRERPCAFPRRRTSGRVACPCTQDRSGSAPTPGPVPSHTQQRPFLHVPPDVSARQRPELVRAPASPTVLGSAARLARRHAVAPSGSRRRRHRAPPCQHLLQHGGGQPAREGVLLAHVVAAEQLQRRALRGRLGASVTCTLRVRIEDVAGARPSPPEPAPAAAPASRTRRGPRPRAPSARAGPARGSTSGSCSGRARRESACCPAARSAPAP